MAKYCPYCASRVDQGDSCPYCNYASTYRAKPHHLRPGTLLHNKYLVGRVLGEGGFGITYVGRDLTLDMKVAIKEYFPANMAMRNNTVSGTVSLRDLSYGSTFRTGREQFIREAQTLAELDKENAVVTVRDFFSENESAYIVMEFIEGENLKEIMKSTGKALPAQELLSQLEPIFASLSKAHEKGLVHRDISPDNIMIENGKARLIDFGCAGLLNRGAAADTVLKHGFSPPEQYANANMGPWTDVYAMAATIYYCVTGRMLPRATDRQQGADVIQPTALGAKLTKKQERALMKALSLDPAARYPSMAAFGKDLFVHRNRYKTIAIAACALAAAAALGFVFFKPKEVVQTMEKANTVTEVLSASDELSAEERTLLEELTASVEETGLVRKDENTYYRLELTNRTDRDLENLRLGCTFYNKEGVVIYSTTSSVSTWEKGQTASVRLYPNAKEVGSVKVRASVDFGEKRLQTERLDVQLAAETEDAKLSVSLKNTLPETFSSSSYYGNYKYEITSFSYDSNFYQDKFSLYLIFGGSLVSGDEFESNYYGLSYRITDASGTLFASGEVSMPALKEGERFENVREYVSNVPPGDYIVELSDYSR